MNGACVSATDKATCDVNRPDVVDSSVMSIILAIVGVLSAIAIGILVYCFCCAKKSDDNYNKVGE